MSRARAAGLLLIAWAALFAPMANAEDTSNAKRDVVNAADFRVRMTAALALGKSRDVTARPVLEQALADSNPAVRTAAAAALNVLGDINAIAALQRQLGSEAAPSVKSQLTATLASLNRVATLQGVQLVLEIGSMKNATSVRGEGLALVLRASMLAKARSMNNVVVADASDIALLQRAASKHVPVLALDGTVLSLTQTQNGQATQFSAQVEFSMRRIPDQTLKGVLSGRATSMGQGPTATQARVVAVLQDQAVEGAVESALRGADQPLLLAAK